MTPDEARRLYYMRMKFGDPDDEWFARQTNEAKNALWYTLTGSKWRRLWLDTSELHPVLRHYEGCRVIVDIDDEKNVRFHVGRTGGWRPATLRLHNCASRAGDIVRKDAVVRIRGTVQTRAGRKGGLL